MVCAPGRRNARARVFRLPGAAPHEPLPTSAPAETKVTRLLVRGISCDADEVRLHGLLRTRRFSWDTIEAVVTTIGRATSRSSQETPIVVLSHQDGVAFCNSMMLLGQRKASQLSQLLRYFGAQTNTPVDLDAEDLVHWDDPQPNTLVAGGFANQNPRNSWPFEAAMTVRERR